MAMMTVGGVAFPNPSSYTVTLQDLDSDNTHRSETGILNRERIRAGVYKINATWTVKYADLKKITQALSPDKFVVTFFDPTTASYKSAQMYAGDRSARLQAYTDESAPEKSVWELTCALVEY